MIKSKFKKVTSLLMAALMCVTAFAGIGTTTVYAAGDIGTISFTNTYDSNGNAMRYNGLSLIHI